MNEGIIYTDEQVSEIADHVATTLRTMGKLVRPYLFNSDEYKKGPFGVLSLYSSKKNPLGKFPVEAETLTTNQKAIVTKIVGEAMTEVGADSLD